jgi:hypothetical protein
MSEQDMEHEKYSQKRIEAIKRFCLHVCVAMLRSPLSPTLFASNCMPARYCLTKGGKFWKYDRYEHDLALYLVSVGDKVDNFLECDDEMEVSMSLEATPEMASLFASAPNMSLADGPLHEPQAPALPPRKDPKRKRADVDKAKKALGCKF